MLIKRFSRILAALVLLPLTGHALERSDLLPPEAPIYMRISSVTNGVEMLMKSSLGKLWTDEQFQDFLGQPMKEGWEALLYDGELTEDEKIELEQLKMTKGELIIAGDMGFESPYIVMAMGKEDFLHSLELDDKASESETDPFRIIRDSFQGEDVIQHIYKPGTPEENAYWQAQLNDTLVMGPSQEWVEKSILKLKQEAVEEPEGNPVVILNVPIGELIRKEIENGMADPETTAVLEAMGLLDIRQFTMKIELKDTEIVADNTLYVDRLDKGLFTVLDTRPTPVPTDGFIPGNIATLEAGRFDLFAFWKEVQNFMTAVLPEQKPQLDLLLGMVRQQAGIDLEMDLLANMGNKFISFGVVEDDQYVSNFAIELKDSRAFKRALETALTSPGLKPQMDLVLETVDFIDQTLYVSKDTEPSESFAFAVVNDLLLYGSPSAVRQVIRDLNSGTATRSRIENTELAKGLRQYVPSSAFGFGAIDWKKCMTFLIRALDNEYVVQMVSQEWAISGAPIPPPDFSKLPPADHIASFFNITYTYVEKSPEGLHQRIILKN